MIRFVELYHQVRFPQALTLLREWCGVAPLLNAAADFYRFQLHRHHEPLAYLDQRGLRSPEVIEHMRIGYAAGGGLRGWLTQLGYPLSILCNAGLITNAGTTATFGASSSLSKVIFMAAVFVVRHHPTDCYLARRAACICGSQCVAARR